MLFGAKSLGFGRGIGINVRYLSKIGYYLGRFETFWRTIFAPKPINNLILPNTYLFVKDSFRFEVLCPLLLPFTP